MKFVKTIIAATALAGLAGVAQAQEGAYGAIGVSSYNFDIYGVEAKLGYNFSEYFGVEAQAGFGVIKDKETVQILDTTYESETNVSSQFAGFATARYPVSEQFDVFARAGYHTTKASSKIDGGSTNASDSGSEDGFALGFGGQYNFSAKDGVRLEYTYYDADGGNMDGYALSYVRKF